MQHNLSARTQLANEPSVSESRACFETCFSWANEKKEFRSLNYWTTCYRKQWVKWPRSPIYATNISFLLIVRALNGRLFDFFVFTSRRLIFCVTANLNSIFLRRPKKKHQKWFTHHHSSRFPRRSRFPLDFDLMNMSRRFNCTFMPSPGASAIFIRFYFALIEKLLREP